MFTVFIKQYIFGISVFMQFLDYWFTIPPYYSRTWSNIHIWGGFSSLKEFISFEYSEKSPHHSLLTCWQVWDRCIINICRYDLDVNERLSMSIGVSPVTKCRIQVLCIPCLVYMTNFVLNNFTIQIIKLCPESVFSSFQHFMFYSEAPWAVRTISFTWYNTGNTILCWWIFSAASLRPMTQRQLGTIQPTKAKPWLINEPWLICTCTQCLGFEAWLHLWP